MKRLVIASNNPGKLREIAALLLPLDIEATPQSALAVSAADEPYPTFVENALAKARHASSLSGLPALADDSGLCVDALAGAPGVHSARFAGSAATDDDNNAKLLESLRGANDRRAHYVCVVVLLRSESDPQPIICEAKWRGEIIEAPRGSGGFGYDPFFLIPELKRTGAELTPEHKNRISHRGKALAQLVAKLRSRGER